MVKVLFECQHLYYLPQFLPIISELQRRGGYDIALSLSRKTTPSEQVSFRQVTGGLNITVIDAPAEAARQEKLAIGTYDVIFIGNVGGIRNIAGPKSLVVMVYHGIGLKQSYYRDMDERVDLRAVESEARLHDLQEAGAENLVLTGFTKLDPLANAINTPDLTTADFDLDHSRKTLLYAPTFYPSSFGKLLPVLPRLTDHFNILIKLHAFGWHHRRYRWQSRQAAKISGSNDRIRLVPPDFFNILPLYRMADGLISGLSSTIFEYLALDRPIVKTEFHSLRLKHRLFPALIRRRLDRKRAAAIDFTYHLYDPAELPMLTTAIFRGNDDLSPQRRQAAERYLYKLDGRASQRLIDAVEQQLIKRK
ncbi:MAG: CDP-glycerol glycerophosphotransferase family protein [Candidatus Neomarinimicrobiota bacterium]